MDTKIIEKTIAYGKQRYRMNMKGTWYVLMYGSHGPNDPPVGLSWKWHSISESRVPEEVRKEALR